MSLSLVRIVGIQAVASCDRFALVSLTYALASSRTGFRKTDTIINRIIRGAVQTGLFCSIFALGDLFSFLFADDTYFYAMFAFPLGRIYTNVRILSILKKIFRNHVL